MQATQTADNQVSLSLLKSRVNEFLNKIDDFLYSFSNNGYDKNNTYDVFKTIRNEVFNDDSILKYYNNNQAEELISFIDNFEEMLSKLKDQYDVAYANKHVVDCALLEYNEKINKIKKPLYRDGVYVGYKYEIIRSFIAILASVGLLGSFSISKNIVHKIYANQKTPERVYYNIDSVGGYNKESHFNFSYNHDDYTKITDYSETDEAGYRIKREYNISNDYVLEDSNKLLSINLSTLEPTSEKLVYEPDINNKSTDHYREYEALRINFNNYSYIEDLDSNEYLREHQHIDVIFATLLLLMCIITLVFALEFTRANKFGYVDDFDMLSIAIVRDIFKYLVGIVKYKSIIRKDFNGLKLAQKEKEKYGDILDKLYNQIDENIRGITNNLILMEGMRKYKTTTQVIKAKDSYNAKKVDDIKAQKQLMLEINNTFKQLSEKVSMIKENVDYSDILHSIEISPEILFEKVDDHLRIKKEFKEYIMFFDLSLIHFNNVECNNIDFSGTNAVLNIQTVYNKDISGSKFNDRNIPDWSDYSGVNITNATLNKNINTMLNLNEAIRNNRTIIRVL